MSNSLTVVQGYFLVGVLHGISHNSDFNKEIKPNPLQKKMGKKMWDLFNSFKASS